MPALLAWGRGHGCDPTAAGQNRLGGQGAWDERASWERQGHLSDDCWSRGVHVTVAELHTRGWLY